MQETTPESTHRVLVVGGRGFLGRRTVSALRALPGMEVRVGTRATSKSDANDDGAVEQVALDLCEPATYPAVDDCQAVVNCADVLKAPPLDLANYCRERGILFVETTADADTIEQLLAACDGEDDRGPGAVLVGVGLFPGLSNLLATRVADRAGATEAGGKELPIAIEIGIDPLSGAGRGTVELMVKVAREPEVRMPETVLLAASRGASEVTVSMVPIMRWARPMARFFGRLLPSNRTVRKVLGFMTRMVMVPLRLLLLRGLSGHISIAVQCGEQRLEARTRRGFEATAQAIAATASLCLQTPPKPGCHPLDSVLGATELVTEMRSIPGCDFAVEPALSSAESSLS